MIETITFALATPIAKVILDKFYESVGSKLGEKAVEALPQAVKDKVTQLGELIWNKCLKGKQVDDLLEKAADGAEAEQKKLKDYLHSALDRDADLRQEVKKLADEIHQSITVEQGDGGEVWNVTGEAEKNVFEDNKAPIFKDVNNSPITFNNNYYGKPPEH